MNQALKGRLDELSERIRDANSLTQRKWSKFDEARQKFAETGGADTKSREFKATEDAHKEYDEIAAELKELEKARNLVFSEISSSRSEGEGKTVDDLQAGAWLDAEVKTLTSGSGAGDALTPVETANFFFDRLAAMSVGLESGFSVIVTDKNSIAVPHVSADQTASWTAEGDTITASDVSGESITVTPRKLTALEELTREVWRDSEPAALAITETAIIRSISLALDLGFFEGSGTAPEIRGLKNVSGIQSVSMGTNGAALDSLDPFADAIGLLEAENANATAIAMHPRSWKAALKLKELTSGSNKPLLEQSGGGTEGIKRTLYGVPVFLTSQVSTTETQGSSSAASSAYVYDASQVVAVRRQETEVDIDEFYKFDKDVLGIRAISRWGLAVPNPKSVVRVAGLIP